jgi:DNA-binding NtrC family response regulator
MRDPEPARQLPRARVLLVAHDRRYRAVTATLLSQRGYTVTASGREDDVVELAVRERADVVVIDATSSLTAAARQAARLDSLRPRVGVVAVAANSSTGLTALPVLPKWASFDQLSAAIERAGAQRTRSGHAGV